MGPLFLAEWATLGDLCFATRVKFGEQRRRKSIAGLIVDFDIIMESKGLVA
jgi:hypothetical protein